MNGKIFVLSAPSGTGKTTISQRLKEEIPELEISISSTTRPKRPDERAGRDYHFLSRGRFQRMIKKGQFAEWALVYGNYYGTPAGFLRKKLGKGRKVLLTIDTQGGLAIRKKFPDTVLIGLLPPSIREQEKRIRIRSGLSEAEIKHRLEAARQERRTIRKKYDFRVINRNLDRTVGRIKKILLTA